MAAEIVDDPDWLLNLHPDAPDAPRPPPRKRRFKKLGWKSAAKKARVLGLSDLFDADGRLREEAVEGRSLKKLRRPLTPEELQWVLPRLLEIAGTPDVRHQRWALRNLQFLGYQVPQGARPQVVSAAVGALASEDYPSRSVALHIVASLPEYVNAGQMAALFETVDVASQDPRLREAAKAAIEALFPLAGPERRVEWWRRHVERSFAADAPWPWPWAAEISLLRWSSTAEMSAVGRMLADHAEANPDPLIECSERLLGEILAAIPTEERRRVLFAALRRCFSGAAAMGPDAGALWRPTHEERLLYLMREPLTRADPELIAWATGEALQLARSPSVNAHRIALATLSCVASEMAVGQVNQAFAVCFAALDHPDTWTRATARGALLGGLWPRVSRERLGQLARLHIQWAKETPKDMDWYVGLVSFFPRLDTALKTAVLDVFLAYHDGSPEAGWGLLTFQKLIAQSPSAYRPRIAEKARSAIEEAAERASSSITNERRSLLSKTPWLVEWIPWVPRSTALRLKTTLEAMVDDKALNEPGAVLDALESLQAALDRPPELVRDNPDPDRGAPPQVSKP